MGLTLTIEGWANAVGLGEDDAHRALCAAVGSAFDRDEFDARYLTQDRSWREDLPTLPGVDGLFAALRSHEIPIGVASSSSEAWVHTHLVRLGLRDHVAVLGSRDQVGGRSKPDPASYRFVVDGLGVDPARTVAIEDSAPGVAAAIGAGLTVVAVPSAITGHTDLSGAHQQVPSLEAVSVPWLRSLVCGGGARASSPP
jgi:putative hydrolase of the HAD superfamily